MLEKDRANLLAILDSCQKISRFTADLFDADAFFADSESFDAVLMNFILIGEAVSKISVELKATNSQIPWQKIKGFRYLAVHDYFGVDAEEIWQIVQNHLPELEKNIEQTLSNEE
ncbi:MAG: DUF86 domain-containing protein [Bacteroidetes bacterium]|nr:DUF86 domain-containing protein [Bacteroidota bacterium]